ncbi:MAG TPA: hypothetical protein VMS31_03605 [Pyrinomonadaceae bacterium]|nr:hypothetical protein [Pyrinomonadaceae bacterium]
MSTSRVMGLKGSQTTRLSNSGLSTVSRGSSVTFARAIAGLLLTLLLPAPTVLGGQKKSTGAKPKATAAPKAKPIQVKPTDELGKLRDEYIKATDEYQGLLKKQLPGLERNVAREQEKVTNLSKLFGDGLVSKKDLETAEMALGQAKDKVAEIHQSIANADSRIADTLLEAEAEKSLAKLKPIPKGGLVSTAAMIRYNGGSGWMLAEAWKVQRYFLESFKKPLPVAVFGQGSIHDRWRLDHRNSMDVSLHPDGPEGQGLLNFLRANGIPFLAFRQAIPGTATGPHIHIGRPSHRY